MSLKIPHCFRQVMKFIPKAARIGDQSAAAAKFTNV